MGLFGLFLYLSPVFLNLIGYNVDYDTFLTVILVYLLLHSTYHRFVYLFLNPSIEGSSFTISSPNEITWGNILNSISSFSKHHTGREVKNQLGDVSLSVVFPYVQRRFMWKKASKGLEVLETKKELLAVGATMLGAGTAAAGLYVQSVEKQRDREHLSFEKEKDRQHGLIMQREDQNYLAQERERDRIHEITLVRQKKLLDPDQPLLNPPEAKGESLLNPLSTLAGSEMSSKETTSAISQIIKDRKEVKGTNVKAPSICAESSPDFSWFDFWWF